MDDNVKENRQKLQDIIVKNLKLIQAGDTAEAFMLDKLVTCIEPDMAVYKELKKIIFSE